MFLLPFYRSSAASFDLIKLLLVTFLRRNIADVYKDGFIAVRCPALHPDNFFSKVSN
jgi:hypothetical protein